MIAQLRGGHRVAVFSLGHIGDYMIQNPVVDLTDIESQISNLRTSYQLLFSQRGNIGINQNFQLDGTISVGDLIQIEYERENHSMSSTIFIVPILPYSNILVSIPSYENIESSSEILFNYITVDTGSFSIGGWYYTGGSIAQQDTITYMRVSKLTVESDL